MLKTITFNYTGAAQTFIVPKHVTKVYIKCYGAQGYTFNMYGLYNTGGKGGLACGTYILKPNDNRIFNIYVGGTNGYNGGGIGGNGNTGGGASDIRINGTALTNRVIVAGGGGGASGYRVGGDGGGFAGESGQASGGTQTSGGYSVDYTGAIVGRGVLGQGGVAWYNYIYAGPGGGGYYGGGGGSNHNGTNNDNSGGGGSSYIALLDPLDASTTSGVRTGNGLVEITYEEDPNAYFLEKDKKYYIIDKKYFDNANKIFLPVKLDDIYNELVNTSITPRADMSITSMLRQFVVDNQTYNSIELIDFKEYKLCILSKDKLYKMTMHYAPSDTALSKTNIKVKEKFVLDNYKTNADDSVFFLDIEATDKTQIDYFFDYGEVKSYKSCSILNTDEISNDFYVDFKLNAADSLLQSVTLYGKNNDKYTKLKEPSINVYDDLKNNKFIKFNESYNEVIINELCKQSLEYTMNTLDKF